MRQQVSKSLAATRWCGIARPAVEPAPAPHRETSMGHRVDRGLAPRAQVVVTARGGDHCAAPQERFLRGMTRVLRCGGRLEAGAEGSLTPLGILGVAPVRPGC